MRCGRAVRTAATLLALAALSIFTLASERAQAAEPIQPPQPSIVADKDFYLLEVQPGDALFVKLVLRVTDTSQVTPAVLTVQDVSIDEEGRRTEKAAEPGQSEIERAASWVSVKTNAGAVLPPQFVRFGLAPEHRKPLRLVVRVPVDAYPGDRDVIATVKAADGSGTPARIVIRLRIGGGDIYSAALGNDIRSPGFVLGSDIGFEFDVENTGNLAQRVEGTGTALVAGFPASEPAVARRLDLVPGERGTLAGRITLPWSAVGFQRIRVAALADPLGSFSEDGTIDLEAEKWVFVVPFWLPVLLLGGALVAGVALWAYRTYERTHRYLRD